MPCNDSGGMSSMQRQKEDDYNKNNSKKILLEKQIQSLNKEKNNLEF